MEIEAILKEATQIIQRHVPAHTQILLFGSWAKGEASLNSDLDIGILAEKTVSFEVMMRIRNEIEAVPTLRKIDVVDLRAVDDSFRNSAMAHHRILTSTS